MNNQNTMEQPADNATLPYSIRMPSKHDDLALRNLISTPMTTRGIQISFQREPSYFQAADVIYEVKDYIFIEHTEQKKLIACCSNGYRTCYVNGKPQAVRYSSDLRVSPKQRGKHLVNMVSDRVRDTMHDPDFSQLVIFNDNMAAKMAVQNSSFGKAAYHDDCLVETLTLTGFKTRELPLTVLPASHGQPASTSCIRVVQANALHAEAMNDFVKQMSSFYNFIPAYNFKDLVRKHSYFKGLDISDFYLFYQDSTLTGMFGLWRQSDFKQTKILSYGKAIGYIRPFYNLWARWSGHMPLPRKGETIKYHVLHSLLCHPQQLQLHDYMLRTAMKLSREQRIGRIAFTLSLKDPRQQLNHYYKGERLTGMHGFFCYKGDPRRHLDAERITYLECGRI